jgi:hypothetical protein
MNISKGTKRCLSSRAASPETKIIASLGRTPFSEMSFADIIGKPVNRMAIKTHHSTRLR